MYLENTLIFSILHRDGMNKDKLIPNVKEDPIVERVKKYVTHDMVIIMQRSTRLLVGSPSGEVPKGLAE